jgi:hypothetical protein
MYKVIAYLSTWEVYNETTHGVVMEKPFPYYQSSHLDEFFHKVPECKTDDEVEELYENTVRKWQDE